MVESSLYRLVQHMNSQIHYFPNSRALIFTSSLNPIFSVNNLFTKLLRPAFFSVKEWMSPIPHWNAQRPHQSACCWICYEMLGVSLSIYTFQLRSLVCSTSMSLCNLKKWLDFPAFWRRRSCLLQVISAFISSYLLSSMYKLLSHWPHT